MSNNFYTSKNKLTDFNIPLQKQGFCIWFTGLSGAGKSTISSFLVDKLMDYGRQVTLLDGDEVRTHLSKGLGFSREDRDTNVKRIGYVASEIVRHGGVVICAAISPYEKVRNECRSLFVHSSFIEVFVDTPLEICEARDTKGLYQKARQGCLLNFTGINNPYESPKNPEIRLSTISYSPIENTNQIIWFLLHKGLLSKYNLISQVFSV